ncbi:hypothetical protein I5L59_01840 [Pseudomonas moraviensis]|uniref:hypothetical protein n=1 Tax=Pseudomonas moraviensis TaxID=321662 RepID=UPI0018D79089|nr:hypothetical protein [Pseudomonas moraviensis]MBH3442320.1 hypothetical protein [Pseudomonas moraviensis]
MTETTRHPTFDFISIIHPVFNYEAIADFPSENKNASPSTETSTKTCTDSTKRLQENLWYYSIDGITGRIGLTTQEQAIQAAEEDLFGEFREYADKFLRQAIDTNNIEIALALAELRGFHNGRVHAHRQAAKLVKEAWTTLEPLSRL